MRLGLLHAAQPSRQFRRGVLAAFVGAPASAADVPGGRYGEVHVSEPADAMRGLIILFSDLSGWSDADRQAAS